MRAGRVLGVNPPDHDDLILAGSPAALRRRFKGDLESLISVRSTLTAMADSDGDRLELDDAGISLVGQQAYRCDSFRILAEQQALILREWRLKRADSGLNL